MKKYLLIVIMIIGFVFLIAPSFVMAQNSTSSSFSQQFQTFAKSAGAGEEAPTDPRIVVAQVIKMMFGVVGIMFFAYSVYAGYMIMSSSGDEQKVKKGKDTLRTGIIGIFVAMSAYSILALVADTALKSTQESPATYADFDIGNQGYW